MINRRHKDRLFSFLFGGEENKEWTLSLYNAVNGSDYADANQIEITTIEDAVYMGMKNDISFLLHGQMSLWEQQSSFNPNMPVRELMYMGKLYDKYIHRHGLNIYGKTTVELPLPKLVVFYNGTDRQEDDTLLRLSDAFAGGARAEESDIEVRVRMLNINKGHNRKLMEACRVLSEYAWFVQEMRDNAAEADIEAAVDRAIEAMPDDFQIKDFLTGNRAEVKDMCITEYNEEETMQMFKEEGKKEGRREGRKEGRREGRTEGEDRLGRLMDALFTQGRTDDARRAATDRTARNSFYEELHIV